MESGGSLGEHAEEEKCALQSHLFGERLELYKTIVRDGGADACRGKLSLMSYIFIWYQSHFFPQAARNVKVCTDGEVIASLLLPGCDWNRVLIYLQRPASTGHDWKNTKFRITAPNRWAKMWRPRDVTLTSSSRDVHWGARVQHTLKNVLNHKQLSLGCRCCRDVLIIIFGGSLEIILSLRYFEIDFIFVPV